MMLLLTPYPSHEEQEMTHRSASKASPLGLQQMIQEAPAALVDQEEWVEEVLDDSALDMLNNQCDHLTAKEPDA